jgi:hypothetical protein
MPPSRQVSDPKPTAAKANYYMMKASVENIESLRREALATRCNGWQELVAVCDKALAGDDVAIDYCATYLMVGGA